MWCVVLLTVSHVYLSHAELPLPAYIKPCARTDPEFNKCALKSARETIPQVIKGSHGGMYEDHCLLGYCAVQSGRDWRRFRGAYCHHHNRPDDGGGSDRKYKVPALDPLEIEELKIADAGPRQAGLSLVMKNAKVYGMRNSMIEETNFDFVKKHVHHEMVISHAEIIGKYQVTGRVLLLPITGNGDINITLENTKVTYDNDYTLEPINGNIHMVIKSPKATVVPARAYFHLTNLFNGDPVLGNQMNVFLDENWREVYKELSPAVITAFTEIITAILKGISGAVPFDVAFPEKLPSD